MADMQRHFQQLLGLRTEKLQRERKPKFGYIPHGEVVHVKKVRDKTYTKKVKVTYQYPIDRSKKYPPEQRGRQERTRRLRQAERRAG